MTVYRMIAAEKAEHHVPIVVASECGTGGLTTYSVDFQADKNAPLFVVGKATT